MKPISLLFPIHGSERPKTHGLPASLSRERLASAHRPASDLHLDFTKQTTCGHNWGHSFGIFVIIVFCVENFYACHAHQCAPYLFHYSTKLLQVECGAAHSAAGIRLKPSSKSCPQKRGPGHDYIDHPTPGVGRQPCGSNTGDCCWRWATPKFSQWHQPG